MKILGMDLGTSNTYIYICQLEASGRSSLPEPLVIRPVSDENGSISTVVLYEDDKPIAIGNIAESEFNTFPSSRRFMAAQFKPEISKKDSPAQRWTTDFLSLLAKALPPNLLQDEVSLYVGIPSLAREDFAFNLSECFIKAGWPKPEFVRESDAALVSCLQDGALHIEDMESKCLILDFGGGTCDFTSVEGLDVTQYGGDTLYGGRLFDDLVFKRISVNNPEFGEEISASPSSWFVHWLECKKQKEDFSDFINRKMSKDKSSGWEREEYTLHVDWVTDDGVRKNVFAPWSFMDFKQDAENYAPTRELLEILRQYANRGGLTRADQDILENRVVALLTWMRDILDTVEKKLSIKKIILTGGSSRWYFVRELCKRLFSNGICVASRRGYEDIAFGLALFPSLLEARSIVSKLLDEKMPFFIQESIRLAEKRIRANTEEIARLCGERIVERDILPVLEETNNLTFGDLETRVAENITGDKTLLEIARQKSSLLNEQLQEELGHSFRNWLKENGVILTPVFQFPGKAIEDDFFHLLSEKLKELDSIKIARWMLSVVIPLIVATTTAHFLAPLGEPVSIATGVGLFGGTAWLSSKFAHDFLAKRKIPSFILGGKVRTIIINKNRAYIDKELMEQFASIEKDITREVEKRLKTSLTSMIGSLSVLNQIETR